MLWVCDNCTTGYSVGAPQCPHCESTDYHEQGAEMPKNTRARGATNAETDETGPEAEPVEAEEDTAPATRFPSKAAPKSEWVEAAESLGAPAGVLAASKTDIQEWVTANS